MWGWVAETKLHRGRLNEGQKAAVKAILTAKDRSALRTGDIRKLLRAPGPDAPAPLEPQALVPEAVAEITGPDFPGERFMVCLNPRLGAERRRKREDLLQATERTLADIAAAAARRKPGPANRDRTIKALGRKANRRKVEKHFDITVHDAGMDWARNPDRIRAEARLDGIYVVRTSLDPVAIGAQAAVEAYKKSLAGVERAFLTMKTSRLRIRPVHVYSEDQVRAHVFLCMLAYHNGTCAVAWPRSCSRTTTARPPARNGPRPWSPPRSRTARRARPTSGAPRTDCRFTASRRCSPTSAR